MYTYLCNDYKKKENSPSRSVLNVTAANSSLKVFPVHISGLIVPFKIHQAASTARTHRLKYSFPLLKKD